MAPLHVETALLAKVGEVFAAWTDPARLQRWFRPSPDFEVESTSVDARAGGGFEVRFRRPAVTLRGTFRAFAPDRHLQFELTRAADDGAHTSSVRVDFTATANGTRIDLHHDGLRAEHRDAFATGWQHCLGLLAGECPRALDDFYRSLESYPRFHSRFGGFWTDLTDGEQRLRGKHSLGLLDADDAARFRHWRDKGYVVLERAVPPTLIDTMRDQLATDWTRGNTNVTIELCDGAGGRHRMAPALRDRPHKLLDYHASCAVAREIQFVPAIRRFLAQLFERPPMVFQSLMFRYGTEQPMHQDTAYVVLRSPMEFVGCWIALEDVQPGSGELQYYEGSHRIPEYLWFDRARARPPGYAGDREFLAWVRDQSERAGCPLVRFLPKKGDVLLWHADLVHGGAKRVDRERTRWSLVSHYCPADVEPDGMADGRHSARFEHAPGCYWSHPLH